MDAPSITPRQKEKQVFECFDKVFDEYNSGKTTKEYMLKRCKFLHKMLPAYKVTKKGS